MSNNAMRISIYRYNPEVDDKPYMQDYTLQRDAVQGQMLLDALEALKVEDASLSFRRSCGEGVCGSDGMNINGKNGLACIKSLASLPNHIILRPLPGFPVIRDLIVDMTPFYTQYEAVDPYLKNSDDLPSKERLQSPEERAALDGLYECILCGCCTSACPSYWWNPEEFLGPSALLWAARFLLDSRDNSDQERLSYLDDLFHLFRCRSIMNCVDTCPKGLNPTEAIGKIRKKIIEQS